MEEKLARLAHDTRQSRSDLAAEAVHVYVDQQLKIVEGINRGIADLKAGRVVPHAEARDAIDALIEKAQLRHNA